MDCHDMFFGGRCVYFLGQLAQEHCPCGQVQVPVEVHPQLPEEVQPQVLSLMIDDLGERLGFVSVL